MPEFLLFRLCGPLAAWGEIAVGERRGSYDRPGKSAVLGLVAAALGIERSDEAAHRALHEGYGYAVRVDAVGTPLRDYHTTQVPPARRNRSFRTRREELAAGPLNTILSSRDYYADAVHVCGLWPLESAPYPLGALKSALQRPRFALYLGRKSCPLGLPLAPAVVTADGLATALAAYPPVPPALWPFRRLIRGNRARLYFDPGPPGDPPPSVVHHVSRRDGLASRRRWQFADRVEAQTEIDLPPVPE